MNRVIGALVCVIVAGLAGCGSYGAQKLDEDQVDYAQALSFSKRRQILANIVSLRFADSPSFLSVTQIIAGHSAVAAVNTGGTWSSSPGSSSVGTLGGSLSLTSNPTFTFTPTTGQELADSYIRPLSPEMLMPLAQSGVPIDLLMRLGVQSVGSDLHNSDSLSGSNPGTVGFFQLIHALRRLQEAGAMSIRYQQQNNQGHVFLAINSGTDEPKEVQSDALLARKLLHADRREVELVYGSGNLDSDKVAIVTRSIQGILSEIGAQIPVPAEDVQRHSVLPTVGVIGEETRPVINIHVDQSAPPDAYADIVRSRRHYWIADDDFDSKFAFSVVQNLIALAESSQSGKQAVVTIPATP